MLTRIWWIPETFRVRNPLRQPDNTNKHPDDFRAQVTKTVTDGIINFVRREQRQLTTVTKNLRDARGDNNKTQAQSLSTKKKELTDRIGRWNAQWQAEGMEQYILQQVARLWHLPRLQGFALSRSGKSLVLRTSTLYGFEKGGRTWHEIGEMEICMGFYADHIGTNIVYRNCARTVNREKYSYCAPQITGRGTVGCWGTTGSVLGEALGKLHFLDAAAATIRFAECAEHAIEYCGWPIVPADTVPQWYRDLPKECW